MKKIMLVAVCALAAVVLISGCTSTHVSKYSAPLTIKVETSAAPEVTIGKEISGEATIQRVLFFKWGATKYAECVNYGGSSEAGLFGDIMGAGKAAAAYNACEKANCDVIICPRYEIVDKNFFVYQKTEYKVVGYAGNFKGVK